MMRQRGTSTALLGHVIGATGVTAAAGTSPNLTITVSPDSVTVPAAGGNATYNVNVKSTTALPDALLLVPISDTLSQVSGVTVSSTDFSWNTGDTQASTSFTVHMPKVTATTPTTSSVHHYSPITFALLLLPVMLAGKVRKLRVRGLLLATLVFGAIAGVAGCGSSSNGTGNPITPSKGSTDYPIYLVDVNDNGDIDAQSNTVHLIQENK
ncbi:MAG: hypothetical protein FWD64_12820 [Acidobacteriaceae bacterium]|nr:hypothetical protein [Acidobacteriaceae bacterium]